jgi:3-dehydroquinate dehydratase-2
MSFEILIVNGPNLNMLGARQPEIYGRSSLNDVKTLCENEASVLGLSVDFRQSNLEGELVGWIQDAQASVNGLLLNAGALTHSSIAVFDALASVQIPAVEIHMSNIHRREKFREMSYVSLFAAGMVCGFGSYSYVLGLRAIYNILISREQ